MFGGCKSLRGWSWKHSSSHRYWLVNLMHSFPPPLIYTFILRCERSSQTVRCGYCDKLIYVSRSVCVCVCVRGCHAQTFILHVCTSPQNLTDLYLQSIHHIQPTPCMIYWSTVRLCPGLKQLSSSAGELPWACTCMCAWPFVNSDYSSARRILAAWRYF